jgi:hypothetical protein
VWFAVLCALSLALAAAYTSWSMSKARSGFKDVALPPVAHELDAAPPRAAPDPPPPPAPVREERARSSAVPPAPPAPRDVNGSAVYLLRHTGSDRSFGFLAVDPGDETIDHRRATPLACERVHFAAAHGVCLVEGRPLLTSYSAVLFDSSFRPHQTVDLDGIPSRVRVSPNGRLAAITVFVGGHSYADNVFSTATSIVNTETGEFVVENLEEFQVVRDGRPFKEADFNFWGVTFEADSNRFYATLGTGGSSYLIEGEVARRTTRIVRDGVECPSLSPDNTRVAFKKPLRVGATRAWRLTVLNLQTLEEVPLAETRSVDDQAEWLDDQRVLYGLPKGADASMAADVWVVPSDGTGRPEVFLKDASSPTVVRSRPQSPSARTP